MEHTAHIPTSAAMLAKDAIRALESQIVTLLKRSEAGAFAYEQANFEEPPRISAIIAVHDDDLPSPNVVAFTAYLELEDEEDHVIEAEIRGVCEKLPLDGGGWRALSLDIIDAGPLPKSG